MVESLLRRLQFRKHKRWQDKNTFMNKKRHGRKKNLKRISKHIKSTENYFRLKEKTRETKKENRLEDFNLNTQILYKHIVLIFLCCSAQPKTVIFRLIVFSISETYGGVEKIMAIYKECL